MEDSNEDRCVDKYDEIFNAVLSKTESEIYSSPIRIQPKDETSKTNQKKRQLDMKKDLSNTKQKKNRRETTKDRLLEWNNFYANQKFGIWIQCTKCNKWRKVLEYEEDHEVPREWCCSMSVSGIKDCDAPENEEERDFSLASFVPGSIVWAKVAGYPWWPGMVEDDPDIEEFYWENDNGSIDYHITFLDDKVTHAWVPSSFVCPFLKTPRNRQLDSKTMQAKYSHLIEAAKKKANEAIHMPIKDRLQYFSLAHRYTGKWPSAVDLDDNEDTADITEMLIKELDDVESINSSDSDYKSISSSESKRNKTNVNLVNDDHVSVILDSKKNKKEKPCSKTMIETSTANNAAITSSSQVGKKQATKLLKKFIDTADHIVTNVDPQIPKVTSEALVIPLERNEIDIHSVNKNESLNDTTKLNQCVKKHKTTAGSSKVEKNTTVKRSNQKLEVHKNVNSEENRNENIPSKLTSDLKITDAITQNSNSKSMSIKSDNKKFKPPIKENKKLSEYKDENNKKKMKMPQRNKLNDSDSNMNDEKNNTYNENIRSNSNIPLQLGDKFEHMVNDKMKEKVTEQSLNNNVDIKLKEIAEINPNIDITESKSTKGKENNENIKKKKEKKINSTKKQLLNILEKHLVVSTKSNSALNLEITANQVSEEINLVEDSKSYANKDVKNQAATEAQNIVNPETHDNDSSEIEEKKRKAPELLGKNSNNSTLDSKISESKKRKNVKKEILNREGQNYNILKKSTKPSEITKQNNQMKGKVSKFSVTTCETEGKENKMKNSKTISNGIQNKKGVDKDSREADLIVLSDEEGDTKQLSQEENCNNYFSVAINEDMQQEDEDSDPFEAY